MRTHWWILAEAIGIMVHDFFQQGFQLGNIVRARVFDFFLCRVETTLGFLSQIPYSGYVVQGLISAKHQFSYQQ